MLRKVEEDNHLAGLLETHINAEVRDRRQTRFLFSSLARELKMPLDKVREILLRLGAGSNGFSVCLPKLDKTIE